MKEILFSLNIVLPMAILLAMGYVFQRMGLMTREYIKTSNKLCFYVFLAASLFKNLYDSTLSSFPYRMILFVVVMILLQFSASIVAGKQLSEKRNETGVIIQGTTRSNFAYVGIPLSTMMFSDAALVAKTTSTVSMLSIVVIPLFNILAVTALTYFGSEKAEGKMFERTLRNLLRNPCILSVMAGVAVLLFRLAVPSASFLMRDRLPFLYKVLGYLAAMSTPFALILVGAGLDFSHSISNRKKLSVVVLLKTLIFPSVILFVAYLTGWFENTDFAALISLFGAPTAVASAVMATEMKGDGELANEIVVYTTLFSVFSLIVLIFILKTVGCL